MSDAVIIVDLQAGSFGRSFPPCHDAEAVFGRFKDLAQGVGSDGGLVIAVDGDRRIQREVLVAAEMFVEFRG